VRWRGGGVYVSQYRHGRVRLRAFALHRAARGASERTPHALLLCTYGHTRVFTGQYCNIAISVRHTKATAIGKGTEKHVCFGRIHATGSTAAS
jgi:hypothetical protein